MLKRHLYIFPVLVSLLGATFPSAYGQKKPKAEVQKKNFVSFGLEVSPIIPTTLFNASGTQITNESENIRFTLKPMLSYRFGGSLRFDVFNFKKLQLGNMFTINTGIFYTQRAFRVTVDNSPAVSDTSLISNRFRYVSYEIPLMLQLHLQASNRIWVNFAVGTGAEFYPSQVYTKAGEAGKEGYFFQYTARKFIVLAPLKASFGVEYRTEKSGYFGIGASISRPMPYMADTYLEYWKKDGNDIYAVYPYGSKSDENRPMRNQGMYLSVDFRYYFQPTRHEKEVVPSYIRDRQKNKNR